MKILAIDPGTTESGWCKYIDGKVAGSGVEPNVEVADMLGSWWMFGGHGGREEPVVAIEMVASYGMPVGAEVFRTVWWCGRFAQEWLELSKRLPYEVYRKDVKLNLCGSLKAKDGNIRQAIIDKLGPAGTKKAPGPTYGVKSHAWAALAVALTVEAGAHNGA